MLMVGFVFVVMVVQLVILLVMTIALFLSLVKMSNADGQDPNCWCSSPEAPADACGLPASTEAPASWADTSGESKGQAQSWTQSQGEGKSQS